VGLQVFTLMKTLCSEVVGHHHFGGSCCCHLQGDYGGSIALMAWCHNPEDHDLICVI